MSRSEDTRPRFHVMGSAQQLEARKTLIDLFRRTPLPTEELLVNPGLYIRSSVLAKLLYVNELYERIVGIPGVIVEFGVWWGQNLALFESLRAIYEPYNHTRKVIGFDTFAGYASTSNADGSSVYVREGAYDVSAGYEHYLAALLDYHERENTLAHIKKYELVKGDATVTAPEYFERHPHTIVALAYLDMQLYEPTRAALEAVRPHLVRGSVVAIDELGSSDFPGETAAVREVLGLDRYRLEKSRYLPDRSFVTVE